MKFSEFAKKLNKIEKTDSRNDMTDLVVQMLNNLSEEEVAEAMYLTQGRVAPKYVDLEFNIASKLMQKSITVAFGKDENKVKEEYDSSGDLGLVAEKLCEKKSSKVKLMEVFTRLKEVASFEGEGSQDAKIDTFADLLNDVDRLSARYLVRIVLGNLRLGLSDKTVLDALSIYAVGDKSKREVFDKAFGARNDLGSIAELLVKKGLERVEKIKIVPGFPIAPMLCEREDTIDKIFERMNKVAMQPKYDGLRCQLHFESDGFEKRKEMSVQQNGLFKKEDEKVRVFSRNLETLSDMFPDIKKGAQLLGCKSFILDGEIIGWDENTGSFMPFQWTIQRRRKYKVKDTKSKVPVRLFVFDILYLDGKDLTQLPLIERLTKLENIIDLSKTKKLQVTPTDYFEDEQEGKDKFHLYINKDLEGIIAKDPNSKYELGKRSLEWIKFKRAAQQGLADTIDCVVLGYYYGRGTRAKFGIGAILVGVLNKKAEAYVSIAKVGTGIKDEQWSNIKNRLDSIKVSSRPKNYKVADEVQCDVWVEPDVVVEVEADEITRSEVHATDKDGKGYSLRFPRLKVFDRADKSAREVTSLSEIEKLFNLKN